jgi:hypothetical protein
MMVKKYTMPLWHTTEVQMPVDSQIVHVNLERPDEIIVYAFVDETKPIDENRVSHVPKRIPIADQYGINM